MLQLLRSIHTRTLLNPLRRLELTIRKLAALTECSRVHGGGVRYKGAARLHNAWPICSRFVTARHLLQPARSLALPLCRSTDSALALPLPVYPLPDCSAPLPSPLQTAQPRIICHVKNY